jgi:hypothetical protein
MRVVRPSSRHRLSHSKQRGGKNRALREPKTHPADRNARSYITSVRTTYFRPAAMYGRMMEHETHALLRSHRELAEFRAAKSVVAERSAAAFEILVQIDHEGEEATLPVRALEVAVAVSSQRAKRAL